MAVSARRRTSVERAARAAGYQYDDERVAVLAVDTMPWWGRAAAWCVWRCPHAAYGLVIASSTIAEFYWLTAVIVVFYVFVCYGRVRQPDPFHHAVLVERYPVADKAPAEKGEAP